MAQSLRVRKIPLLRLLESVKRIDVAIHSTDTSKCDLGGIGLGSLEKLSEKFDAPESLCAGELSTSPELERCRLVVADLLCAAPWSHTVAEISRLGIKWGVTETSEQFGERRAISEKLRRILLAKSPFEPAAIDAMSEPEGWAWVYSQQKATHGVKAPEVCFTGFSALEKSELEELAASVNLKAVAGVTKGLLFLVAGANAGPAKLAKARSQGTPVLDRQTFERFAETGELPVAS